MVDVTVGQLAEKVNLPADHLLKLMQQAGLPHERNEDIVSDEQKTQFLSFVQRRQPTDRPTEQKKITVRRRNVSTLRTGKGGRGAAVKVETRRKKIYVARPPAGQPDEADRAAGEASAAPTQAQLEAERIRSEDLQRKAAEEEVRRQEAKRREEAEERRRAEEAARVEAQAKAEADARDAAEQRAKPSPDSVAREAAEAAAKAQAAARAAESGNRRAPGRAGARHRDRTSREDDFGDGRTRRRELSLKQESRRSKRRHLSVQKQGGEFEKPQEFIAREVEVSGMVTVGELAQRMSIKAGEAIKALMGMGVMATINQPLDQDTAILLVEELGHKAKIVAEDEVEQHLRESLQVEGESQPRAPVVTVMGHVDHGKTSLLDHIRHTRVVAGEAGGITQHIGAYHVNTEHGDITFIDTPGHAAFSAMRARGARSTDVVVLVVAADDGVMPQTEEAVNHSRAADVPMVVAVNKMDLDGADPERVRNELAALGVTPEDWGGTTQFVNVSAETGEGIDALLEAVLLQAELMELTAVPSAPGKGVVIESRVDRGRGPVATLLVQNGTLNQGDVIIAGECYGRVRALANERGETVKEAAPSTPVEMLGLNGTPEAGDEFSAVTGERQAREVADFRAGRSQAQRHASQKAASLESMFANLGQGEKRVLKVILKADVRGSLEAVTRALRRHWQRRSVGEHSRLGGWRHHRIRRQHGADLRGVHLRLQHPRRSHRQGHDRARVDRFALLQRHL